MTTNPGLKRTCPSRKESACKSSTTRECPRPCSPARVGELPPSSLLRSPQAQLSPGMGAQGGMLWVIPAWSPVVPPLELLCHGCSDLSKDISAGGDHLPPLTSSQPHCSSPLPCSLVTKPPPLLAGQSVPSNAGLRPRRPPAPISAQLPLVCLHTSAQPHGCFPLCLHGVSDLSFSLDSFFLSSVPCCHLGEKWTSGVYCRLLLLLLLMILNDKSLSAACVRARLGGVGLGERVAQRLCS